MARSSYQEGWSIIQKIFYVFIILFIRFYALLILAWNKIDNCHNQTSWLYDGPDLFETIHMYQASGARHWKYFISLFDVIFDTYISCHFLPSSVQVGKFSASRIGNWDWFYNHCETHPTPPRKSILQVPRKLKFCMQAKFTTIRWSKVFQTG